MKSVLECKMRCSICIKHLLYEALQVQITAVAVSAHVTPWYINMGLAACASNRCSGLHRLR